MKRLRTIRIVVTVLFLAASIAYLVAGARVSALAVYSERLQVVPSAIATCIGITLFWLAATLVFGRVYCSSVCPVGTIIDGGIFLRRVLRKRRGLTAFRYKHPYRRRYDIAAIYAICLLVGVVAVPLLLEPWQIFRSIVSVVQPSALSAGWLRLGVGAGVGIAAGAVSLILLILSGLLYGRDFCNFVCPLGAAYALLDSRTIYHIEIDPDACSSCLKCEEACPSSCIKVVSRYVDNARCVKCLDCLSVCPDDAIHYQANRNRPRTPLLRKVSGAAGK